MSRFTLIQGRRPPAPDTVGGPDRREAIAWMSAGVSAALASRARQRRVLLVITDGKPNDLDHYEGQHGIEDSRMAIREARRAGQAVYGIAIEAGSKSWFPRLFGRGGFTVISHPDRLTEALPGIYRQLVGG